MANWELKSFANATALAQQCATDTLALVAERSAGRVCVAISGGRIAKDYFSSLARQTHERGQSLARVHFFWADERCVPPTDAESNYRSAAELLFTPLALPAQNIHRVRGEDEPGTASREAETELREFAMTNAAGELALDLVLLGMGEDGHIASLFPGEPDDVTNSPAVYRPVTASKPPPRRITLGYGAIAAAWEVWVLASGTGKESALRESLSPTGKTPLGRLLRSRNQTRIYTDLAR